MFGLLVDGLTIAELPPEISKDWQTVDLASGRDHAIFRAVTPNGDAEEHVHFSFSGLDRLRAGLNRAGLDPRFFAWPPENDSDRPPYRGLKALEAEDAGIFFGREAPTIAVLDRLRGLREAAAPRFLAILGASGAGKSSFLRAGLIPRLARDDRHFLPLPVLRAERAALSGPTGLVATLTAALAGAKLGVTRAQVQEAVQSGASAVLALLSRLVEAKRIPQLPGEPNTAPPTLILSIDQGEELFLAEGTGEAQGFLSILRGLVEAPNPAIIVIVAIRSDGYERLQSTPALDGVQQETFSLPPMPRGAYETVIEGPARRLRDIRRPLVIEPALTQTLLADIEAGGAKDALPLLAFTLERLYIDHGGDGDLTLEEYSLTGGVRGSIEAAIERAMQAADGDARVPKDRSARLALIRAALIPWLAGIDPETGAPRRRVARLTEIPKECRPLVEHLVAARLLATDVSPEGAVTIEPAHEALLRQWGLLQGWLEEDFAALSALDGVKRTSRDWHANARDSGWLAHAAGRLEDAEEFSNQGSLRNYLDESDRAYLAACRSEENARRDRELEEAKRREADAKHIVEQQSKIVWRTMLGLVSASILFLIASGFAIYAYDLAKVAEERRIIAEKAQKVAEAQTARANTAAVEAENARIVADKNANEARFAKEQAQKSARDAEQQASETERASRAARLAERVVNLFDKNVSRVSSAVRNPAEARRELFKSMEAEAEGNANTPANPVAGRMLAGFYAEGYGVEKNRDRAVSLLRPLALAELASARQKQGTIEIPAVRTIGNLLSDPPLSQPNLSEALRWAVEGETVGDAHAINLVGWVHHLGKTKPPAEIFNYFERAAILGSAPALSNVAWAYDIAYGVKQNYQKSYDFSRRAAELGNLSAMQRIGHLYHARKIKADPTDDSKNDFEARAWFRKGAEAGNVRSIASYGWHLEFGKGGPKDIGEARRLYELASDGGNAFAMYRLADILIGERSYDRALAELERGEAAAQKDIASGVDPDTGESILADILNLRGFMAMYGLGAPRDADFARRKLNDAWELGNTSSSVNFFRLVRLARLIHGEGIFRLADVA